MKVAIVDYGMGNIKSIYSTLKHLGVNDIAVSGELEELKKASRLILPGVGSYCDAMERIKETGLDESLQHLITEKQIPVLGICLGMQLLAKSSEEKRFCEGLSYVDAKIEKLPSTARKIPHVGFNQVKVNNDLRLYSGFEESEVDFYFTHSFCMRSDAVINGCNCDYGGDFIASFERDNVAGVQYHPELSQHHGLKLLNNFIEKF